MSSERQFATEVLRGKISNLRHYRRKQDFVLSEAQQSYAQATAAAGVALGMGASAMGLLQMAANSTEEADWVEFDLDGKPIVGWVWKMPMREGDAVEVVAEPRHEGGFFGYSIRRDDGLIAIYPHATSGTFALYRRIMKYMVMMFAFCFGIICVLYYSGAGGAQPKEDPLFPLWIGGMGLPIFWFLFHRAYLRMAHFAKMAEVIFSSYGWSDVRRIDLIHASKGPIPANEDPDEFGIHYFRYQPGTSRG